MEPTQATWAILGLIALALAAIIFNHNRKPPALSERTIKSGLPLLDCLLPGLDALELADYPPRAQDDRGESRGPHDVRGVDAVSAIGAHDGHDDQADRGAADSGREGALTHGTFPPGMERLLMVPRPMLPAPPS